MASLVLVAVELQKLFLPAPQIEAGDSIKVRLEAQLLTLNLSIHRSKNARVNLGAPEGRLPQ